LTHCCSTPCGFTTVYGYGLWMQLCILLHAQILSSPSGNRVWPRLRATGRRPTCHHWLGASRLQRFKHRASRDVLCGLGYATLALAHRSRLRHLVTLRLRLIGLTPIGSAPCDSTLCCSRPRGSAPSGSMPCGSSSLPIALRLVPSLRLNDL
jgi:hypothetical protein